MDSSIDQPLGITPPISTNLPTQAEMTSNEALLEHLRKENSFESASDTEKRKQVLKKLEQIANAFIKQVAKAKEPHNARLIKDAIGRIFTYGSYRLGVYGPGSDIDTLLIAPKYVTREDYFTYFPGILREMSPDDAIEDLTPVEDAFVPIIKMEYCGISIDLIFSKIATLMQLPSDSNWTLQDSNLLRGLDEAELRSVNGTRVTDEIINLVPEPSTFRLALRAIKLWAQRRAVYGNIIGFPGGVAWAMMVARVCQLYPKAASSVIVHKFFNIMLKWPWPDPVLLKAIEAGPLNVSVWNPKVNRRDAQNLMPIITPAYPSMCATYNVTKSTMSVIKRELHRAGEVAAKIIEGRAPWKDLFERHSFFTDGYKFYLAINTTSTSKEHHKLWSGFIESKVRILCQNLENHDTIDLAHPFIKGFNRKHWCKNDDDRREVANGNMDFWVRNSEPAPKTTGVKQEEANGADVEATGFEVYSYTHYVGIELIGRAKSLDLSAQIQKFKSICTDWQRYKDEFHKSCALTITIMRNFELPDDCFGPGDVKPARPKKKKKRSAPDGSPPPAKRQQTSVAAAG